MLNEFEEKFGEEAYLAYGSVTDMKNFRGEPMLEFKDLPEQIKKAWIYAAFYCFQKGYNLAERKKEEL